MGLQLATDLYRKIQSVVGSAKGVVGWMKWLEASEP
jgi:hypothetical protein